MPAVHLGKMHLRWCHSCNAPVLEMHECPKCNALTHNVRHTPPGDIRPAFRHDYELIKKLASEEFGSTKFIEDEFLVLNRCPAIDKKMEIIAGGFIIGRYEYILGEGYHLFPNVRGAMRMGSVEKGWVEIDDGAVRAVLDGKNVMGPGIKDADQKIKMGNIVIIYNKKGDVIGVGTARRSGKEMIEGKSGVAIKVRYRRSADWAPAPSSVNIDDVIEINRNVIEKRVEDARRFIDAVSKKYSKMCISFSGGKDSMATALLVADAHLDLPVTFVNTGIELKETVEFTRNFSEKFGKYIEEDVGDRFWKNLKNYGHPSRDYRWCCKVCKLGPMSKLIRENFGGKVLTFIGQRRYESEKRMQKGRIWKNPWIIGQIGASPIQDWSAMHVWLYIFMRKQNYNIWYDWGLDRIGCFLCPASDMAELESVKSRCEEYKRWKDYLSRYNEKYVMYGLWRWRKIPPGISNFIREKIGIEVNNIIPKRYDSVSVESKSCDGRYMMEIYLPSELDLKRFVNLMAPYGKIKEEAEGVYVGNEILIHREGYVSISSETKRRTRDLMKSVETAVKKTMRCTGCSICISICENDALFMSENGTIDIIAEKCTACSKCLTVPCPAVKYDESDAQM